MLAPEYTLVAVATVVVAVVGMHWELAEVGTAVAVVDNPVVAVAAVAVVVRTVVAVAEDDPVVGIPLAVAEQSHTAVVEIPVVVAEDVQGMFVVV